MSELQSQIKDAAGFIAAGQTDMAVQFLDKALQTPEAKKDKFTLAKIHSYIGMAQYRGRQFEPAAASLSTAIDAYKELLGLESDSARAKAAGGGPPRSSTEAGKGLASIIAEYMICLSQTKDLKKVTADLIKEGEGYARTYQKGIRRAVTLDQLSATWLLIGKHDNSTQTAIEATKLAETCLAHPIGQQVCMRAWTRVAEAHVMQGHFAKALEFYDRIETIPSLTEVDRSVCAGGRGLCMAKLEKFVEAKAVLEKAATTLANFQKGDHPNLPSIYNLLAECNIEEARKAQEEGNETWRKTAEKAMEWIHKCEESALKTEQPGLKEKCVETRQAVQILWDEAEANEASKAEEGKEPVDLTGEEFKE